MRRMWLIAAAGFAFACGDSKVTQTSGQDASSVADGPGLAADTGQTTPAPDGGLAADSGPPADSGMSAGEPIVVPLKTWTWVDFPDSYCDDGSHTGIGVSTSTASNNLIIFLNGGGACWDYQTCFTLNTATHGPFGAGEFRLIQPLLDTGIFDRTAAGNVFKDWSFVFVPYCTGDVHGGDNIAMYPGGGGVKMYYHKGHANVLAYLKRLAPTFPAPPKLVLSGSSAGGYGSLFNYVSVHQAWPDAGKVYLVDDSGPPLENAAYSAALRQAWFTSWNIAPLIDSFCPDCGMELSKGVSALASHYPNDRLALLETLQDRTIRSYYGLTATDFQTALTTLLVDRFDPTANFKYFIVSGETHTMLATPGRFMTKGTVLSDWLRLEVTDDAGWMSLKP